MAWLERMNKRASMTRTQRPENFRQAFGYLHDNRFIIVRGARSNLLDALSTGVASAVIASVTK
jgi:hypothetical protein